MDAKRGYGSRHVVVLLALSQHREEGPLDGGDFGLLVYLEAPERRGVQWSYAGGRRH